ncbi:MAG: hypothetical protein SF070_18210 [Gemmatimonadota bacterium]|nr:hypothetical protein [Gemmatimonadota bacterium]
MPLSRRAGATLAELVIGLVLFGLVGTLVARQALGAERVAREEEARVRLQAALDAGLAFLSAELADLGPGDLMMVAAESLRYRATRGHGLTCQVSATEVRVAGATLSGARAPQPGRDSLQLPLRADDALAGDTGWTALPLLGVHPTTCGGRPAIALVTAVDTLAHPITGAPATLPVRVFEVMQTRLYASAGSIWLGARSVSAGEVIQPVAGPFELPASRFVPRDSSGLPTAAAAATRSVRVSLSGQRARWQGGGGVVVDSAYVELVPANLGP